MNINLEQFEDGGRNAIQMALARELYGNMKISTDEMLERWVEEGYAKRFGDYLKEHPEMDERLFVNEDKNAYTEIKKNILYH